MRGRSHPAARGRGPTTIPTCCRRWRGESGAETWRSRRPLLRLHLGVADHLAPLLLFRLEVGGQILRRADDRFEILPVEKALAEFRIGEEPAHLGVDLSTTGRGVPAGANRPNHETA